MSRVHPSFVMHPADFPVVEWRARILHVVDGDTFDALVDVGFGTFVYQTLRLRDFDAEELRGGTPEQRERASQARDYVRDLLTNRAVLLRTYKDRQTFGRYVADVYIRVDGLPDWVSVAELLAEQGFAKEEADV